MSTETTRPLTLGNVLLAGATTVSDRLGESLAAGPEADEIKAALAKAAPGLPLGTLRRRNQQGRAGRAATSRSPTS